MVLALQEPSSRGKPTAIFVEALDPGIDPAVTQTTEGRWIPAPQAAFVLGVKRRGVMGPPTVAYANTDAAQQVAKQHGGSVHGWNQLVEQIVSGAAKR